MGGPLADAVLLDGVAVAWLAVLIRSAIQATGLLIMVGLIAWIMRSASAAVRHLLWLGTMIALARFPLATDFLPGWQILPHWEAAWEHYPTRFRLRHYLLGSFSGAKVLPGIYWSRTGYVTLCCL